MISIAAIGECMIELSEHADGRITRGWGGDTLNTAVYLARLGLPVDYITGLGDDAWSSEMLSGWAAEGIGTSRVARMAGRLPGLYVIQTNTHGERRFSYWRDRAPAREIFDGPDARALAASLDRYSHIYVSGISLSLYGEAGRAVLFAGIDAARASGAQFVFDTNFRLRGWPDRAEAKASYQLALQRADVIFASTEDLDGLFGGRDVLQPYHSRAEVILKLPHPACEVVIDGIATEIAALPVADVVDTTAAGDSFAAAFLAARIRGADARTAALAGHRLAGAVVQHRGAIIPRGSMPAI